MRRGVFVAALVCGVVVWPSATRLRADKVIE